MIFDKLEKSVRENAKKEFNCIPFPFERFSSFIPGIQQRHYYNITANSGVGKSQITDELAWFSPYEFYVKNRINPNFKTKVKFFYFSLEMDKESKFLQAACRNLFKDYNIRTSVNVLKSIGKNRVTDDLYQAFLKTRTWLEELENFTDFIEEAHPYHIYRTVQQFYAENGTITKKKFIIDGVEKERFDYYTPNDPDLYVIVIVDHLDEITWETGDKQKETMQKHTKYMKELRNRYGPSIFDIQQQAAASESVQNFQLNKLEPSLTGLGEDKTTQRRYNTILGLFSPFRHELMNYRGYDIRQLKDNYRSLIVLKNRNGPVNVVTSLFFDGATNYFKELPLPDDPKINSFYKIINNLKVI